MVVCIRASLMIVDCGRFWIVCNCVFACVVMCMYILYIYVFNLFCHITEHCMINDASGWWCFSRKCFPEKILWTKSGPKHPSVSISFLQAKGMSSFPWICVKNPFFSQHVCLKTCVFGLSSTDALETTSHDTSIVTGLLELKKSWEAHGTVGHIKMTGKDSLKLTAKAPEKGQYAIPKGNDRIPTYSNHPFSGAIC